jgi:hypothetical protein
VRARRWITGLMAVGMLIVAGGGGETGASPIWHKGDPGGGSGGGPGRHGGDNRIERPIGVPVGGYPLTWVVPDNGLTVTD